MCVCGGGGGGAAGIVLAILDLKGGDKKGSEVVSMWRTDVLGNIGGGGGGRKMFPTL